MSDHKRISRDRVPVRNTPRQPMSGSYRGMTPSQYVARNTRVSAKRKARMTPEYLAWLAARS